MSMDIQTGRAMAEYIGITDELITDLREKVASLESAETRVEKEASAPVLDPDAIKDTVSNIITAGFLKKADQEAAVSAINSNPATLLDFLDKLAAKSIQNKQAPKLGRPIEKAAVSASERASDAAFERTFGRLGARM